MSRTASATRCKRKCARMLRRVPKSSPMNWRPTGLDMDYVHQFVNHAEEYVSGNVHTNGIENFWSLLKRGLKGTYVSVEPFHLFRYLDEQAFRYNERKHDNGDGGRFAEILSTVAGRRLTYKELTGKMDDAP